MRRVSYENFTDASGVVWRVGWGWNTEKRVHEQKSLTKVLDPNFQQLSEPWYRPLQRYVYDGLRPQLAYFGWFLPDVPPQPWLRVAPESPVRQGTEGSAADTQYPSDRQ